MRIDNSGNSSALIAPDPVARQLAAADAARAARIIAARRRIADGVYSSPVVLVAIARRLLSSGDL